jgi:hypothetical protein
MKSTLVEGLLKLVVVCKTKKNVWSIKFHPSQQPETFIKREELARQDDQIGRISAYWVIVYFGKLF